MNLAESIQACLTVRNWTASKLATEAGVPIPCVTRVLTGERAGMHSSNLLKLAPFLSLSPGQGLPCDPASSREPGGAGEDGPPDHIHVAQEAIHCRCGAMAVISDPVGGPRVEQEFREKHRECGNKGQ